MRDAVAVRESVIERHFATRCRERGALCLKFTSPGRRAVPDRIVLWHRGYTFFAEIKAPGQAPTPAQAAEHARLRGLGFKVYVIDTVAMADHVIELEFPKGVVI